MFNISDFKYIDVCRQFKNGKRSKWERTDIACLESYVSEAENYSCFRTIQRFASPDPTPGEVFISDLFFDIDYKEAVEVARLTSIKIIDYFSELMSPKHIEVYFSGSKGFHIVIDSRCMSLQPGTDLHTINKYIAECLSYELASVKDNGDVIELKGIDPAVYTSRRMLRIENTQHEKTLKYKLRISIEELRSLSVAEISKIAARPRNFQVLESTDNIHPYSNLQSWYIERREEALALLNPSGSDHPVQFAAGYVPICVQHVLERGWVNDGDRNSATIQLACFYKDAEKSNEEAIKIIEDFTKKHTSASNGQLASRVTNARNVAQSVFRNDNYNFTCAGIRSLGDESHVIPCSGKLCKAIKSDGDELESIHLSKAGSSKYNNKRVKTRVLLAGKKAAPYIVPSKLTIKCYDKDGCKKHCAMKKIIDDKTTIELTAGSKELIEMTAATNAQLKAILKECCGIPKSCTKHFINQDDTVNIEELFVIPKAEDGSDGSYTIRRVYSLGTHAIIENKYYELTGYVFPHPRTQEGTILINSMNPLANEIEEYITRSEEADLALFKPDSTDISDVQEKIDDIVNDISYNVTGIRNRDYMHLLALLTYHSVLKFNVPWDKKAVRGWVEIVCVGDTGTGKSSMMAKLTDYIGLGDTVNAESTSRTGLSYKMEQVNGSWALLWGAFPLADKGFIWVDEMSSIDKATWGELTLARSEGILEVKRAVTAETNCRVRAFLTGNCINGKRLSDYAQGCMSLQEIFNNEDIRRFDAAIFAKSDDITIEAYNEILNFQENKISPEKLRDNILFCWSRTTEQVHFQSTAITEILDASVRLSNIYGNATQIPIVSPSDMRNKIARLAVALAGMLHSVRKDAIVVYKSHVQVIEEVLKRIYNMSSCSLNYYAKMAVSSGNLTDSGFIKLNRHVRGISALTEHTRFCDFIQVFMDNKVLRSAHMEEILRIDKNKTKELISSLSHFRMIKPKSYGFEKTGRFNSYIQKLFERGELDNLDNDILNEECL